MNIKQAKEEIKHTVQAYLSKDAFGEYKIPACGVYHHPPHKAERSRTSVY